MAATVASTTRGARRRVKISSKIVLTFVPLAVVTLASLGGLGYYTAKNALTRQALANLESVADLQQRRIEAIFKMHAERLALVSSRTQLRMSLDEYLQTQEPRHAAKMNRILIDARATIRDFRDLFVQTVDGRIVAATDSDLLGTSHPQSKIFSGAVSRSRVDFFYLNREGNLGVYLAAPLYLEQRLLGVLVIEADASNIVASMGSYRGLGSTGETLLVRRGPDGGAVFLTPARFDQAAALKRTVSRSSVGSPYIAVLERESGLLIDALDYQGYAVLAAFRYLEGPQLGLVVQKRLEEAFAPVDRLRRWTVTLLLAFSALVVGVSLFLARSITRPVMRLTDVAGRISAGKLSERAAIDTRDEVRLLAKAFNQMTERLLTDVEERRKAEEKFQALLASAPDAFVITEESGKIILTNQRAEELLGYRSDEMLGACIEELLAERDRDVHRDMRSKFIQSSRFERSRASFELYARHKSGAEVPVEVSLAPIETREGLLLANAIRDITDRKQAEALLVQQANYDTLTGLPSRILAYDRLSQALAHAHRNGLAVAVMFLDVDRFKNVNDTLGHSVGDALLSEVAVRLNRCIRKSDTVARLGGDEFLIVLSDLPVLSSADMVAEQILAELSAPFQLDGREMFVSASIGITGFPADSAESEVLLRNADAAMYRAKEEGRNTYRYYTAEMNEQLRTRLEMEEQLRHAIGRGELSLDFQPQLDVRSGRFFGAEALLRWRNGKLGSVPPDRFIPLAEETGLIHAIGEWVLVRACEAAASWQRLVDESVRVSVNVSAVQFRRGDLVAVVEGALRATGLPSELLELELTERLLVEDANAEHILGELKRIGVRLSLDDFGTGYSSLSYLKRFPFDVLKIDRLFISGVTSNQDDAALCRAILAMGGSLNMAVIAEGVETRKQLEFLAAHNVDGVQGYHISRPLDSDAFSALLSERRQGKNRLGKQ